MYQILLVDDEAMVKIALQNLIDWTKTEFRICATASNGAEALKYQSEHAIDAVITDLQMPVMDGITLIQKLRLASFHGPILALSNYSDYGLVRGALTAGAFDYLLKVNIDDSQLLHMLDQMSMQISCNTKRELDDKQKDVRLKAQEYEIAVRALVSYLTAQDSAVYPQSLSPLQDNLPFPGAMFTIVLEKPQIGTVSTAQFLATVVNEIFEDVEPIFVAAMQDRELLCLIGESALQTKKISLQARLTRLSQQIQVYASETPLVSFLRDVADLASLYSDYQACRRSYDRVFYQFDPAPLCIAHLCDPPKISVLQAALTDSVAACLKKQDWSALQATLQDFFNRCYLQRIPPEQAKEMVINLLWYLYDRREITSIFSQLCEIMPLLKLCESAAQVIEKTIAYLSACAFHGHSETRAIKKEIQSAMAFVNENYSKKLSLDDIANHVGLNREYLSRLFRKETGVTPFQYLNDVRMRKAAELISSDDPLLIKEVANSVGFDDPFFFSKRFKEYFGVSPTDYCQV